MSKPIEACDCAQGAANVQNLGGHGDCGTGIARPIHGILGAMFKQDQTPNGIIVGTDVLNQAFFDSKFQDENALDRWLLAEGFLTEYDSPIVDPNVEDIPDGRTFVLNKNTKQVTTSIITDEYSILVPVDDITETTTLGRYIATYTGTVAVGKDVEVQGLGLNYVQKGYDLKNLIDVFAATV